MIEVEQGDKIFLYTDGLIECVNPLNEMYGKRKMMKVVESLADEDIDSIRETTLQSAMQFFQGFPRDDDITIVVAEITSVDSSKKSEDAA